MTFNKSIHGLRGLCAFLVFIVHAIGMSMNANLIKVIDVIWDKLYYLAAIGVNIFFAISGYLIIQSLLRHGDIKKFSKNRFIRIYPVYLVILVLMFILGPIINFEWFANINSKEYVIYFFTNLLLLHGMTNLPQAVANSWSLTYEFVFYFIASYFYLSLSKVDKKYLKYTLILIGSLLSVAILVYFPRSLYFLIGVSIYLLENKTMYLKKISFPKMSSILFIVLVWITYEYSIILSLTFGFLMFLDIVKNTGLLSRFLKTKILQYLGTISYSFYLWHPFGLFPVKIILIDFLGLTNFYAVLIFFTAGPIITIVLSHISYHVIEVKITNLLKRKEIRKAKNPAINEAVS